MQKERRGFWNMKTSFVPQFGFFFVCSTSFGCAYYGTYLKESNLDKFTRLYMQPAYLKTEQLNVNISLLYGIWQNFASICYGLAVRLMRYIIYLKTKLQKNYVFYA